MLSANYRIGFAAFLAVFCHTQALVSSHHNNTLANHGFGDETRCNWNCTVIESDLTEEMKTTVVKRKLIRLVVKYENEVDDKCVSQTFQNSSGNFTEYWQIWLANKQLSTLAKALEIAANLMFNTDSNEERKEIRAMCTLNPINTTAKRPTYNNVSSRIFSRIHPADLGIKFNNTDCRTGDADNLQPCINITRSTGSVGNEKGPVKHGGWPVAVLQSFCIVSLVVFVYYSPAFFCLFSPTEVIADGVRQIILEGASPVSFRSPIGNFFFSADDETIWHKAKSFIFRVVIMPLPFLGPAIFTGFKFDDLSKIDYVHRRLIVSYSSYIVQAFCISFFTTRLVEVKPCVVCKFVKPRILTCQDELPQLILTHLHLQPLILVKCWRLFIQRLLCYSKISLIVLPSCKVSIIYLLSRFFIVIVFLSTIPVVTVILFIAMMCQTFMYIVFSSPIFMLCKPRSSAVEFLYVLGNVLGAAGVTVVFVYAGMGTLYIVLTGFTLLLYEESLPYMACFVLVLYYVWSSYSSFTNKYQDLAFGLFEHYKESRHDKLDVMAINTGQVHESITADYEDDVTKIPKELFHMACEKLMPIRNGVCILILKVTIIVSFVLLAFSFTMLMNVGATPVMRALLTFLTGSLPKIIAIYIDGGRQKRIEAMVTDKKISKIVRDYINSTSGSNQSHDNSGADVDCQLNALNTESIELVNM